MELFGHHGKYYVCGTNPTLPIIPRTPFPKGIMLWGCVSSAGTGKLRRIKGIGIKNTAVLEKNMFQSAGDLRFHLPER